MNYPGYPSGKPPVVVIKGKPKRDKGRDAQLSNIAAGKAISNIIRTTLGPKSRLKMILDQMGGVQLTSDGNAILREIDVGHPAAKSMIELARAQDEEVGDGTTSVTILAGELLTVAEPFLKKNIHPTKIVKAYFMCLEEATKILDNLSTKIDIKDSKAVKSLVQSVIGTKFTHRFSDLMCDLAIEAVNTISDSGKDESIDIKRFARIEKIPGGAIEKSTVLDGVIINKDVLHSAMRRKISNPRIICLDCPLEYKKGESATNVEFDDENEEAFGQLLIEEENYIKKVCAQIIKHKPDIVCTEKGCSDLAIYYFQKSNITALRRFRKTDMNRLARVCGAKICHQTTEITENDIGKDCGSYEVKLIGDEYFSFFEKCKNPKACSIILRGPSKDVLNEIERNLQDAMSAVRNIYKDPRIVPGGGATEMHLSHKLLERSKTLKGIEQLPFQSVALSFEVIPRTLADNCGARTIKVITDLRAKHSQIVKKGEKNENMYFGIDGTKGTITDMRKLNIWEPLKVKNQTIKTAIESTCMLLRIDDVVSGISRKEKK